jgi:hypothetical protein
LRERAVLSGALVLYFLVGYFGVGWLATDPADARSLAIPLDAAIPFVLASVVVYWSILPMALLPVFVVADRDLFRRVALAYAVTITTALVIFVVFPVTSVGLRPDAPAFADSGFAGWLFRLLHFLDPPLNLFPSLHLALAFLAALAAVRAGSALGAAAIVWTLGIAVSVCTTKQHFAVDAIAGLALAAGVHRWLVASPRAAVPADASFGARGIALFAGLVALFYAGLYGAYLVGFEPWSVSIG